MKILSILVILGCCLGCNSGNKEVAKIVEAWEGKEILFPDSLELKICGRDTVVTDLFDKDYMILNYVDTTGCTACQLKLYEWHLLKKEADSLHLNVNFLLVAYSNNYPEIEVHQQTNLMDFATYYDYTNRMDSLNHFPKIPSLCSFLLDHKNRVIAIGNPVLYKNVWKLYKKRILSHHTADSITKN